MKAKIITLLAGNSLADYRAGIELLIKNIGTEKLPDSELDQEIIERACAIIILERWMEYPDYIAAVQEIIDNLPKYAPLISNEKVGQHIRGIALFINGLAKGQIELSGFLSPSASGYMMSASAAEAINEHLKTVGEADPFFSKTAAFFEEISSTQYAVIAALKKITTWTSSMARGFYNIMTATDMANQYWLLDSLQKVLNDPIVKTEIFDKYLGVLSAVREKCVAEGDKAKLEQLDDVIKMVKYKSAVH
jgi:hypothetical protein